MSQDDQSQQDERLKAKGSDQNNIFSGPYGNYDVPHAGLAPIPVFRKACGCIMKLVPQTNSPHCEGKNCSSQGIIKQILFPQEIQA